MAEVMEERGLSEEDLVPMLVGAVYHLRSLAYVASTAKPSEAGLRMDLDRLRKAIEEMQGVGVVITRAEEILKICSGKERP